MRYFNPRYAAVIVLTLLLLWFRPAYSFNDPSVILNDTSIGATSDVTVSFSVGGDIQWPPLGAIKVTFPAGFTVTGTGASGVVDILGVDGGFSFTSVTASEPLTVFAQRSGTGQNLSDTDVKIKIKDIVNPAVIGVTDTFLITVLDDTNANDSTSIFTGNTYPEGDIQSSVVADGVVISDPLTLGGGRNSSKFCLLDSTKGKSFFAVWSVLVLILLSGAVKVCKV